MSAALSVASINNAISTANTSKVGDPFTSSATQTDGASSVAFQQVLMDAGKSVVGSVQKAEATSIAGLKGDASAYDVATSVVEAEQSLKMAIAVRDKVVTAYLEISRMQI